MGRRRRCRPTAWREPVLAILREFAERTPGSLIEEKTAGFAWHYRSADPEYGAAQAKELSLHLATLLTNVPVEILPGDKVIEVRPHGIHKGARRRSGRSRARRGRATPRARGRPHRRGPLRGAAARGASRSTSGRRRAARTLRIADVRAARALLEEIAASR